MATSVSSATSTALSDAAAAKANKANAQKLLSALGAGSGVDTASLAQNLVDAERVPQENAINTKIAKNESRISGYSAISFVLNELKSSFSAMKVKSDFNAISVSNSDSNAFTVTPGSYATQASYDVQVLSVAKPQRTLSAGFITSSDTLNQGNPFELSLSIGGATATAIPITASNATPLGVVNAINDAKLPVKAQLVNTGTSVAAVPSMATVAGIAFGDPAAATDFVSFSASIGGVAFSISPLTPTADSNGDYLSGLASDLQTKLRAADGGTNLTVSVAANGTDLKITDASGRAISGVGFVEDPTTTASKGTVSIVNGTEAVKGYKVMLTGAVGTTNSFTMSSPVAGLSFGTQMQGASNASIVVDGISYSRISNTIDDVLPGSTLTLKAQTTGTAFVDLSRDTTVTKEKIKTLVTAFNDANTILKEVSDPKSSLDTFGATLVSDSTVRMISQQMRNMVLGTSSTPATKASGLWQIGVSITQTGELDFDETKIDLALKDNYDDVVKMFTGDKNLFLSTGTDPAGIAGDAVRKITTLLGTSGPLVNQTQTATTQNNKYKEDLTKLQTRMDSLLKRYTTQFASMQSLVGQTNSMKTSLKSSFEGMMSAYTNK